MSNDFSVLYCSLCGVRFGISFNTDKSTDDYHCYDCGHAILLLKSNFVDIDFDSIKEETLKQSQQAKLHESAVIYYSNKLKLNKL